MTKTRLIEKGNCKTFIKYGENFKQNVKKSLEKSKETHNVLCYKQFTIRDLEKIEKNPENPSKLISSTSEWKKHRTKRKNLENK